MQAIAVGSGGDEAFKVAPSRAQCQQVRQQGLTFRRTGLTGPFAGIISLS